MRSGRMRRKGNALMPHLFSPQTTRRVDNRKARGKRLFSFVSDVYADTTPSSVGVVHWALQDFGGIPSSASTRAKFKTLGNQDGLVRNNSLNADVHVVVLTTARKA